MVSKATVIGTGAMGTVCAQILAANGKQVALFATREQRVQELLVARENQRYLPGVRLSENIRPTADPVAALANTELVISAIPCQHLRGVWERVGENVPPDATLCSVTKGIEISTLLRPSEILEEFAGACPVVVLSGPSIAGELARYLPATVVAASADERAAELVQEELSTSWFRIYTNSDLVGVELAGAVKNVVALAAGILDGLRAGDNAKAALVTRGLVEITRLGVAMGAQPETFVGLAGVGDLVTTCVSKLGRNRSAGERIGRGDALATVLDESRSVIEGIPTTRAVLELAEQYAVEMPITRAVSAVLFDNVAPLAAISDLMQRPLKPERRS